jgi:large subunit ribosomal protein L29
MATKRFKELQNLSPDELALKLREVDAEFFQTRMQKVTGQLKDTAKLWRLRKDMARMKTLQSMRGVAEQPSVATAMPLAPAKTAKAKAPAKKVAAKKTAAKKKTVN